MSALEQLKALAQEQPFLTSEQVLALVEQHETELAARKSRGPEIIERPAAISINIDPPAPRIVPVAVPCRRCGWGGR